jgi:hypothetical protein
MAAVLLIAAGMAALFSSRVPEAVASLVAWTFLAILGVALAATLPGAAYALIWPVLVFAVAGWGLRLAGMRHAVHLASLACFVMIALFWVAHFIALDAVIGFNASGLKLVAAFPLALALVSLLQPSKGRMMTLAASGLVMLAAAIAGGARRQQHQHRPQPLAARRDDVFGHLIDQQHLRTETGADQIIDRAHVRSQQRLHIGKKHRFRRKRGGKGH